MIPNAPERIYLQLGDDPPDEFPHGHDVTWCVDKIDECDIEYVRADLFEQQARQIEQLKWRNEKLQSIRTLLMDELEEVRKVLR